MTETQTLGPRYRSTRFDTATITGQPVASTWRGAIEVRARFTCEIDHRPEECRGKAILCEDRGRLLAACVVGRRAPITTRSVPRS